MESWTNSAVYAAVGIVCLHRSSMNRVLAHGARTTLELAVPATPPSAIAASQTPEASAGERARVEEAVAHTQLPLRIEGDRLVIRHGVTNQSDEVVTLNSFADAPGRKRQNLNIVGLQPGQTVVKAHQFSSAAELSGKQPRG